jgi:hypothetical protein
LEAARGPVNGEENISSGFGIPNSIYEQIKLLLVQEEGNIAALERRIVKAQADVEKLLAMAAQVPIVEAELTKLNRDYDVLKAKYEELLGRREASRISRAREQEGQEIQFRVVEPPEIPALPSGPNRMLFLTAVLLAGICSGVGFALLRSTSRESITNVLQLKEAFALPVLGTVSLCESTRQHVWHLARSAVFSVGLLSLIAVYGGLLLMEIQTEGGLRQAVPQHLLSRIDFDWLAKLHEF